jgi:hypothetical protein
MESLAASRPVCLVSGQRLRGFLALAPVVSALLILLPASTTSIWRYSRESRPGGHRMGAPDSLAFLDRRYLEGLLHNLRPQETNHLLWFYLVYLVDTS